ncbi:MAG: hypothetical protein PVG07_03555, partial [Acidobacteriota bacterium]
MQPSLDVPILAEEPAPSLERGAVCEGIFDAETEPVDLGIPGGGDQVLAEDLFVRGGWHRLRLQPRSAQSSGLTQASPSTCSKW